MHPLANLIPESNVITLPRMSSESACQALQAIYSETSKFIGVWLDHPDMPSWARRLARWELDEFRHDTPGKIKLFGDVLPRLADDGAGKVMMHCRHALEMWEKNGRQGPMPYSCFQDYGSCVDASATEHVTTMLGYRAADPTKREKFVHSAAWYWYADRGYCGDGWHGAGCAKVALRRGIAFRKEYQIGSNSIDFTDDDLNEQIVARKWCRSGIPSWMAEETQANHPFEDGAITEFNGGIKEVRALFAAGGVLHTGGVKTSGGSKPFTIGRVGPHMQSVVGADDSDEYRKFCQDVIGVKARDNDFPVVFHQTWGKNWPGECADQYWPAWWGPKPQGAWVWWASDLIKYFSGDIMAWLPNFKGIADPNPTPVPPPGPGPGPGPGPSPNPQLYFNGSFQAIVDGRSYGDFILVPKPAV